MASRLLLGFFAASLLAGCDGDGGADAGDGMDSGVGPDAAPGGDASTESDSSTPFDAGAPTGPCTADTDCDDGRYCTGSETCAPTSPSADERGCAPGPQPCGADEVCVEADDECRPGCDDPDADMDGHDVDYCGGDDCDDTNPDTFTGAAERCDELDNDCDGTVDEGATADAWYGDCDGDGYPGPEGFVMACPRPMAVPPGCTNPMGTWTLRSPADGLDCDDDNAARRPGASEVPGNGFDDDCDGSEICFEDLDNDTFVSMLRVTSTDGDCGDPGEGLAGGPTDCCDTDEDAYPGQTAFFAPRNDCGGWDYNCDGTEEYQYDSVYVGCTGCSGGVCTGAPADCMDRGWSFRVPDCNESGSLSSCTCTMSSGGGTRPQQCR